MAKDPGAIYRSGSTRSWIKVKRRHENVFLVGGIRDVDAFDGVIVGERVGEDLVYRGVVEWGFRAPDVLALLRHARDFRQRMCPFTGAPSMRGAVWFEPLVKAEISYAEVMGGTLRAPSWRGLVG